MEMMNIFCLTGQRGKKWHILQGFADHGAAQKCKASEKQGSKKKLVAARESCATMEGFADRGEAR